MKTTIKTGLVAISLLAIACKKENDSIRCVDKTSTTSFITGNDASKYISIGSQTWMAKNLDITHYRNGDRIPEVKNAAKWAALTTGAWCWYNNDSANGAVYGRLYNWYALNDPRGLAPAGWYLPRDTDWNILAAYLGNNPGGKLKDTGTIEAGTGLWYAPNLNATNQTRFRGLPGGYRDNTGSFLYIGYEGFFWSSTMNAGKTAWFRFLYYNSGDINRWGDAKLQTGMYVRCIALTP